MLTQLERSLKSGEVISVYCDRDNPQCHLTGFVQHYNDSELLLSHITPYGEYDGYVLLRIGDIFRVDSGGDYEKKIKALYHIKKQSHRDICFSSEEILFTLLDFAAENDLAVTLNFENTSVSGFVGSSGEKAEINVVDEYGRNQGISVVDVNEVVYFSVDTVDEQNMKLLNRQG